MVGEVSANVSTSLLRKRARTLAAWAAACLLLLTGCASNGGGGAASGGGAGPAVVKKTIVWLVPSDPLLDPWAAKVAAPLFEKSHPGVHIQIIASPHNNQKLLALEAAGSPPDVFTDWNSTNFSQMYAQGALLDLTPELKAANVNLSAVLPSVMTHYTVKGHVYAVPWLANELVIAYNASLFQKDKVPLPPTSWTSTAWTTGKLLADAQALTHGRTTPATTVWGAVIGPARSLPWLWGGDFFNPSGGPQASSAYTTRRITALYMTNPKVVAAIQWYVNLIGRYRVNPPSVDMAALSTLGAPISSGRVAMEEIPANGMVRTATADKLPFRWGLAPMPYGPGGQDTGWVNENAWMVSAKTKHPKTAAQFAAFLVTLPGDRSPAQYGFLGPTKSSFQAWSAHAHSLPGFDMPKGALTQVVWDGMKRPLIYNPGGSFTDSAELDTAWTQLMQPVYLGQEGVATGLAKVQAKYASIVGCGACKG